MVDAAGWGGGGGQDTAGVGDCCLKAGTVSVCYYTAVPKEAQSTLAYSRVREAPFGSKG